jgi:hypothetical protein
LKVSIAADGTWQGGSLTATAMVSPGLPRLDSRNQALTLVGNLSKQDFPNTGAKIGTDGSITAPTTG